MGQDSVEWWVYAETVMDFRYQKRGYHGQLKITPPRRQFIDHGQYLYFDSSLYTGDEL